MVFPQLFAGKRYPPAVKQLMRMLRLLFWFGLLPALSLDAAPRPTQWSRVDEAVRKGLPKTAIEELDPIIREAISEKAWGEAVLAMGHKATLEATIQGNKPEEKITRLRSELARAPEPMKPLLEMLLGHWYWHYYQNNNWRFLQRTATAQAPSADFTTWDLPRLYQEIDLHFRRALAAAPDLKKIPAADFTKLFKRGTVPDSYRPTLYDLVAHEALQFYGTMRQSGARMEEAFELVPDSPVFQPLAEFLNWRIQTVETNASVVRALQLYQELLRFHEKDRQPDARADLDLSRLTFGYQQAVGENKNQRYKEALTAWVRRWADHPLSAMALYQHALVLQEEGDLVAARNLARRAVQTHPQSVGGIQSTNLISSLQAPSLNVSVERVWNAPGPKIAVQYRNLPNLHFRVVAYDWESFLSRERNRPGNLNERERKELLDRTPFLKWSSPLPITTNLQSRLEELPSPQNLKPGFYFIIASVDPNFGAENNFVSFTHFWVSDLALIVRPRAGFLEGFVLNAQSGLPIKGATLDSWYLDNQRRRVAADSLVTDELGFFSFPTRLNPPRGYLLRARNQGHELATDQEFYMQSLPETQAQRQTIFFTDRSLYRPGQMIQYKGICVEIDQQNDRYQARKGDKVTVVLRDANGQEVEKQQHQANDFGSFSGTFTAPRNRLTGAMSIQVISGPQGMAQVRVEEYKRPKFEVTLEPPKVAPRLNEKVVMEGKAISYSGAPIDQAKISFRVVREVRWPYWWHQFHWGSRIGGQSQEIAHGTTAIKPDGSFDIEFVARPDRSVAETNNPTFSFSVQVDVTDAAGETRSAQRPTAAGYTALALELTSDEWLTSTNPIALRLATRTLDGAPQVAEGSVKIFRLKEPARPVRISFDETHPEVLSPGGEPASNPSRWELGELVFEKGFTTDGEGNGSLSTSLAAGAYRAVAESSDRFGRKVTTPLQLLVLDPAARRFNIKIPHHLSAPSWSVEPGSTFSGIWGTGYESGRAFVEIEHRHRILKRFWTAAEETQALIQQEISEAMRGGFTVHVTYVRENRAYLESRRVEVPWSNKELKVRWEHFRSKLLPGEKEKWTAVVSGPGAEKAVAEMAATLYDASLDAFAHHNWTDRFQFFRIDQSSASFHFNNIRHTFNGLYHNLHPSSQSYSWSYRRLPDELVQNNRGYVMRGMRGDNHDVMYSMAPQESRWSATPAPTAASGRIALESATLMDTAQLSVGKSLAQGVPGGAAPAIPPNLAQVTARKNLNETAFFFPKLVSESNGTVRVEFTMPEALTRWRFMAFAHDSACRSGFLSDTLVTAKDLMVQPNPPRFLREGDELEFTVKVSNQSTNPQSGQVRLTFRQAQDDQSADSLLGNARTEQAFSIPAKESRSFAWKIKVPAGLGTLAFKAVAASSTVSDGEEGFLPVLPKQIPVHESIALPIRGPVTRKFDFAKLLASGKSDTLQHQQLTVQMVSQPAWYAVMALPYLIEYPYECTEQTFNRLYANSLARSIANSSPRIHGIFEQWRNTAALDSPLEKNEELKSVLLQETPWVRQAQSESRARRNVGILFEDNRLNSEIAANLRKLTEQQLSDGSWPWFPGGRGNDYITLYITCGFARLRHLGIDINIDPAKRALPRLDQWINRIYRDILKAGNPGDNHLNETIALYLYTRSFFLADQPLTGSKEAVDYFLGQTKKYWLQVPHRQSQGHLALAAKRFGDQATSEGIMRSIKERSVTDPELGMFWRETELSWWWYRAPIETQALMIEAFAEVMNDAESMENCKVWLIKQKQTQDWKTTKATADAIYALLLRGRDLLSSSALVEVSLGGQEIKPEKVEAGTGFYEKKFLGSDIKSALGAVQVRKTDSGVSWGSLHWTYLENLEKVTPHQGAPLRLRKTLFRKVNSARGPVLEAAQGRATVGDELVVRIELRTDRDMEYVHLKDQRGSGLEPLRVLSQYRYQDGLAFYESTRDTASHYFIDYLPKGTYVFEYPVRVVHKGAYQSGLAEIQCLYAPEFNSHSESFLITTR